MPSTKVLIATVASCLGLVACAPAPALAAWSLPSSGTTTATARSMPAGTTPAASAASQDVTVTWAASTFGDGTPVAGYTVTRYTPANEAQSPAGTCSATVAALTCTDTGVPAGTYTYAVTPRTANWTGAQSSRSAAVTVADPSSPLRIASGSYVGNATDNRRIVDPGFQPDVVVIKAATTQISVMRTSTMTGDAAKPLVGATALVTNRIQTLETDGFSIGTDAQVNAASVTYHWTAYRAAAGTVKVGTYTGTGAGRAVTGLGFSPEHVSVLAATTQRATQRYAGMTRGFQFDADVGTAIRITSLDADGFSLGAGTEVNDSGVTYHYVALNDVTGSIDVATYTGNATDSRNITGVGFQPDLLMLRANDTTTARLGTFRSAALAGDSSLRFGPLAALADNIQALQSDGFQIGTDPAVNAGGITVHYAAMKNAACSLPGPRTVVASADAWVNQSSPTATAGADPVLKVTTRSGSRNTRAFVTFNLPAAPAGCSLTSAKLRLYNKSPIAGRTLLASRATGSWTENLVTWNTQPAVGTTPASAAVPSAAGWMEWNVQTDLAAMYAATNYGFRIADATENGSGIEQQLESREGVNTPELVITFA